MRNAVSILRRSALILLALGAAVTPLRAVIFYATGDPAHNTTAPAGGLAGSGWQFTGWWIGFQGVPVGPHHFLAARHIGGAVGDVFTLNGVDYPTIAVNDDSVGDLRLWEVAGTFPNWAELYRGSDEVGRGLVVMGRGLSRGGEVRVNGVLKGWMPGGGWGPLRWGRNTVAAVVDGGTYWGALLAASFDAAGGPDEAHLATGDSSGPVFIDDGSGWKLAGLAAGVDGPFNTTDSGGGFPAAIFDARGLYYPAPPPENWELIDGPWPVPSSFYATRISAHAAWIDSIVQPPGGDAPLLSGAQTAVFGGLLAVTAVIVLRRRSGAPAGAGSR